MPKKFLRKISIWILVLLMTFGNILFTEAASLGNGLNNTLLTNLTKNDDTIVNKFSSTFNDVFGSIFFVLKVLAVMGIVINGVRYMYAGAEGKGKVKQDLIYVVIGTVLVFSTEIIVNIIRNAWGHATM